MGLATKWTKSVFPLLAGLAFGIVATQIATRLRFPEKGAAPSLDIPKGAHEIHEIALAAFSRERTSSWSGSATEAVRSWFKTLAHPGFTAELRDVECRSHSCVAQVRWKDRNAALKDYVTLLAFDSQFILGCTSEIYLPETSRLPYEAEFILSNCGASSSKK